MKARLSVLSLVLGIALAFCLLMNIAPVRAQSSPDNPRYGHLDVVAQVGGPTRTIDVQGMFAYAGIGPSLHILDVSDPTRPAPLGQSRPFRARINEVVVADDYAYIITGAPDCRLHIVDISNPSAPVELGSHRNVACYSKVAVMGRYAYVTQGEAGLQVLDVNNPSNPIAVGYNEKASYDVTVAGNYAYVVGSWIIRVLDITDPTSPEWLSFVDIPYADTPITLSGNYLFVDTSLGLRVVDVTTPATPKVIGAFDLEGEIYSLAVEGDYLYIAGGYKEHGLHILDVRNPARPTAAGFYPVSDRQTRWARDIAIEGDTLYFATNILEVLSLSDPEEPVAIGSYEQIEEVRYIAAVGDYVYASYFEPRLGGKTGEYVYEVGNPSAPVQVNYIERSGMWRERVFVGDYEYVLRLNDVNNSPTTPSGLHILNVSNPAAPVEEGAFASSASLVHVTVAGAYAYVASAGEYDEEDSGGLYILDVSNPVSPTQVSFYETPGKAMKVAVVGSYAYLIGNPYGLLILDVSNPVKPIQVGEMEVSWLANIAVTDDYLYIFDNGVDVYSLSNPAAPRLVGSLNLPSSVFRPVIDDDLIYLAAAEQGMHIVDVQDPALPVLVGSFDTPERAVAIAVAGENIFVADELGGFYILRFIITPERLFLPLLHK